MGAAVYLVKLKDIGSEPDERMTRLIPVDRIERMHRYRQCADRVRCCAAGIAAISAAAEHSGRAYENISLISAQTRAPYAVLPDGRKVYLSISHSGDWAAAIADSSKCGIDVELIRDVPEMSGFLMKYFMQEEAELVDGAESFFRLWTAKEAYLKYLGTGLSRSLSSFRVTSDSTCFHIEDSVSTKAEELICTAFTIETACFSIVTENGVDNIKTVSIEDILQRSI